MENLEDIYNLSPMQEGILCHAISSKNSKAFIEQLSLTFQGYLNLDAYRKAWEEVIQRHSILRTGFIWRNLGKPFQFVRYKVSVPWRVIDWKDVSSSQQQARLKNLLKKDYEKGFELDQIPLMRFVIVKMSEERIQFIWSYHHILLDGWSLTIVFKDVFKIYRAVCNKEDLRLESPSCYRDYIGWLQEQNISIAKDFWQKTLKGFDVPTPLPGCGDLQNLYNPKSEHITKKIVLSKEMANMIHEFSRQNRVTINTVVLGAWALLLSRYSNRNDIVFGTTVSSRPPELPGIETAVGLFINTLPFRIGISKDALLGTWLEYIQKKQTELRQYDYCSLLEIHQWSDMPEGSSLFGSIVIFNKMPVEPSQKNNYAHLVIDEINKKQRINYPLAIVFTFSEQINIVLSYDGGYFTSNNIVEIMGFYQALLRNILVNSEIPVGDLLENNSHTLKLDSKTSATRECHLTHKSQQSIESTTTGPFSLISVQDRQKIPEGIEDAYPLAALQSGMLLHSKLDPDNGIYHNVICQVIKCPFDPKMFSKAVEQLINRHDILRTSFSLNKYTEPLQLVHRNILIPLKIEDISNMSGSEAREFLCDQFEKEKERSFDLNHPPLFQLYVYGYKADVFTLMLGIHHAIIDGWSNVLLMTELFQQYFFLLGREKSPLSPPPKSKYRDFIALERKAIESDESRQYWLEKISSMSYTTIPRWPEEDSLNRRPFGDMMEVPLPLEYSSHIIRISQQENVPLKSVLLAIHMRLLSIMSNQDDVVTGLVTNCRSDLIDGERILGLFLNILPFYYKHIGGTWKDLIREIFEAEREFLPHRRYPLGELQKINHQTALFDIVFNYNNFYVRHSIQNYKELQVFEQKFFEKTNFPLLVYFVLDDLNSQIHLLLEYDSKEFCEKQIKILSDYYVRLFQELAERPDCEYEKVSVLSPSEIRRLLFNWNDTVVDYLKEFCIHELFEDQVSKSPDTISLVFEDSHLSYHELNSRSNQLARYLRNCGIGPEILVGVYLERSLEMVIGLVGILKSGGAYLPLDPEYPITRRLFMIQESQVPLLLTQNRLIESIPKGDTKVICLDTDWMAISKESTDNLVSRITLGNAAYLIYTSGSTGNPKGVLNIHQGFLNRLLWMQDTFAIDDSDTVLQKTPFSFDVSVWEFFWPLITGARLVVALPGCHRDSRYLTSIIADEQITTIHFVPSMLRVFLEDKNVGQCCSLKRVICSGEVLTSSMQESFFEFFDFGLYNLYGPTEASIDVSYWMCDRDCSSSVIPIGRPIANTQLYILDRYLQPVPAMFPGYLYIGGVGLARGYISNSILTAERFIPNPFNQATDFCLYDTGDLARYLSDGSIEFLGRIDSQVKIRGFRIELGEIESVLKRHEAVQDAVVLLDKRSDQDKRLIAYIVTKREKKEPVEKLRNFLSKRLADYMLPSFFVILDKMPLSLNGKVDRRALLDLGVEIHDPEHQYVAPHTYLEKVIAAMWVDVLGINQVGLNDDFFKLGGHSLLATKIISYVSDAFDIDLPLFVFFDKATVSGLVEFILANVNDRQSVEQNAKLLFELTGMTEPEAKILLGNTSG